MEACCAGGMPVIGCNVALCGAPALCMVLYDAVSALAICMVLYGTDGATGAPGAPEKQ